MWLPHINEGGGGGLDFRTQQYPGGTEIFQNQGGGEGEGEFLKFPWGRDCWR